jgi:hypothetical protein
MGTMLGVVLKALSLTASYYVFSAAVVLLRPAVQQIVEPLEDKLLATVQKRVADMGGSGATKNKPVKLADALPKGGRVRTSSVSSRGEVRTVSGRSSGWDPQELCAMCNDSLKLIGELEELAVSMGNECAPPRLHKGHTNILCVFEGALTQLRRRYPGEKFSPCHTCEQRAKSMLSLKAAFKSSGVSWPASDDIGWRGS